jgi:hypothetical protein
MDGPKGTNIKICGVDLTVKSVPIHVKLPIENLTDRGKGEGKNYELPQKLV